jgi:nucleoside-diphosphate-sugar epimerase
MYLNEIVRGDLAAITSQDASWERLAGKTVVVTGANGMMGSYAAFIPLYLNDTRNIGARVVAMVRNRAKAESVFADVLDRDDFDLVEQDAGEPIAYDGPADFIIHAASQARPDLFTSDPVGTIKANTIGAFHTLDLAVAAKAEGYLFISSREIYGQPDPGQAWFTESDVGRVDPLDVRSCYSEGKRAAETVCVSYRHQYGVDAKVARLSHTYGPGMLTSDTRVQAAFLNNLLEGRDIVLKSTGALVRTYTYVADAASALYWILLDGKEVAYNIADLESLVSIRELAETFAAAATPKLEVVFDIPEAQIAAGWSPVTGGNLDAARLRALGWTARVQLAEGVRRWADFVRGDR